MMAWHQLGDKLSPEPVLITYTKADMNLLYAI